MRILQKWNYTICDLLKLVFSTCHVLEIPVVIYIYIYQQFVPFYYYVVFHGINVPYCLTMYLVKDILVVSHQGPLEIKLLFILKVTPQSLTRQLLRLNWEYKLNFVNASLNIIHTQAHTQFTVYPRYLRNIKPWMGILYTEFHFTWIFSLVVKTKTHSSNRNFCFCSLSWNGTKKKDTCILFFYLTSGYPQQ